MTEHKRPHERKHLWERPERPASGQPEYGGRYPLRLHKGFAHDQTYDSVLVDDAKGEKLAIKQGFSVDVPLTDEQAAAVKDAQSRAKE